MDLTSNLLPPFLHKEISFYIYSDTLLSIPMFYLLECLYPGFLIFITPFINTQTYERDSVVYEYGDYANEM